MCIYIYIWERKQKKQNRFNKTCVYRKNWQSICLSGWLPSKVHLAATPELKKSTFSHRLNRGDLKCYRYPATHNKPCSAMLWQLTLKGKVKEPHWSQRIKPEDLYSVGGSSSSNSSITTELFLLGNILLQVKWLQRNNTYKAVSCLLRVHPVLRVAARTFRYKSQKRIWFYLLSTQKN